jgi:hypothetical protein
VTRGHGRVDRGRLPVALVEAWRLLHPATIDYEPTGYEGGDRLADRPET